MWANLKKTHVIIFYLPYEDHLIDKNIWIDKITKFHTIEKLFFILSLVGIYKMNFFPLEFEGMRNICTENFQIFTLIFSHIEFFQSRQITRLNIFARTFLRQFQCIHILNWMTRLKLFKFWNNWWPNILINEIKSIISSSY